MLPGRVSVGGQSRGTKRTEPVFAKANKDLSRTAVLAPMDGVSKFIECKKGGEGSRQINMMAGTEMLRIADMSQN